MNQKINAIVFSKDKAAQLKLFLDSVNKFASNVFNLNVIVNHTSEDFFNGYINLIKDENFENINFIFSELNLKEEVIKLLESNNEYTCFFLDDDIFYQKINVEEILSQIKSDDDIACFSLRLGENTTHCYTLSTNNVLHDIEFSENTMKWDWTLHYLDFGYPFSMDGHIFRTKDIYKLVKKSQFSLVEELEISLFEFSEMFPRNKMVSYKQSALVGVPISRVQVSLDDEMSITLKESYARLMRIEINKKFLDNKFIKLEEIDFSNINGCHQELDLGVHLKNQENEK